MSLTIAPSTALSRRLTLTLKHSEVFVISYLCGLGFPIRQPREIPGKFPSRLILVSAVPSVKVMHETLILLCETAQNINETVHSEFRYILSWTLLIVAAKTSFGREDCQIHLQAILENQYLFTG